MSENVQVVLNFIHKLALVVWTKFT